MPKQKLSSEERERLLQVARKAARNAYAPYSEFRVGAAVLTTTGEVLSGCNVENVSYGLTICAERAAIFAAVARLGPKMKIRAIVVVNENGLPCSPCGACRQVIYEFGPDAMVVFKGSKGLSEKTASKLLPEGFALA